VGVWRSDGGLDRARSPFSIDCLENLSLHQQLDASPSGSIGACSQMIACEFPVTNITFPILSFIAWLLRSIDTS
jgi:hypothetical protein